MAPMGTGDNELLAELQKIIQGPPSGDISDATINRLTLAALINLDRRIRELEKITPVVKIIMYVFTAIGASVVALIWSLITGQASITFS